METMDSIAGSDGPADATPDAPGTRAQSPPEELGEPPRDRKRCFWAFLANPRYYDIERAVEQLEVDAWSTKGRPVRAGDRVVIWKAAHRDGRRGVVALGEVLSDPTELPSDSPFWREPPRQNERRVWVRYLVSAGLPLWADETEFLTQLTVATARGGSVFALSEPEWNRVVEATGGWPVQPPAEVDVARAAIAEIAGRGQGLRASAEVRTALETHAMALATSHFEGLGWSVADVSRYESYDLCCMRGSEELHVEVKGTSTHGKHVLMTPGEVAHARAHFPAVALFVVSDIVVEHLADGAVRPHGGRVTVLEPWDAAEQDLEPVGYAYRLPAIGT
jgi:hypothetical protein